MKMRIMIMVGCLLTATLMMAQKKEIAEAETYLKSGKNLDKAEKLMKDLLKKESNQGNIKIYQTWYQSVVAQYEAANVKLYLRQKYDTAQFFGLIQHLFQVAEKLDSVDVRPDKKGRVRINFRKRNAERLSPLRINLYYGGTFQMRRNNYDKAYGFFDTYLGTTREPLFADYAFHQNDSLLPQVAYWAATCGYRLQRPDSVLRYKDLALKDTARREVMLQYVCEAYRWQHNDSAYVATLRQGFAEYPEHTYFFPRLADWLNTQGKTLEVLELSESGLKKNKDNQLFLLARSSALLTLERYDECIDTSERLIALNDTMPEAYLNIATVRLNQALDVEEEREPRKNHRRLQKLYQQARPYMEAYRQLAPKEERRWAPGLYRIYLNLNMGKQFDEIDRIMRKWNN